MSTVGEKVLLLPKLRCSSPVRTHSQPTPDKVGPNTVHVPLRSPSAVAVRVGVVRVRAAAAPCVRLVRSLDGAARLNCPVKV